MRLAEFLSSLFREIPLHESQRNALLTLQAQSIYKIAFTHTSSKQMQIPDDTAVLHPKSHTYEIYEQIGDAMIKSFMVNYFYRRFPKLWDDDTGVKIVARLIIKYGSKEILSSLAEEYNFWPHIMTSTEITSVHRKISILEDVFEAFIGATAVIMDCSKNAIGVGFITCYAILDFMFNKLDISLEYEQLFDPKTRLKELIDFYKNKMGEINYVYDKKDQMIHVMIKYTQHGKTTQIGSASDFVKIKAEQKAAQEALEVLKSMGYERKIPNRFQDN